MRKKKTISFILLLIVVTTFLTGCKGEEISKDKVTYTYQKRIEAVELKNNHEKDVYVDFDIILLDKDKEVLYKKNFEEQLLSSEDSVYYDLEDSIPEYITYDKVNSMEAEILSVYEVSYGAFTFGMIFVIIALILIFKL